MGKYVPSGDAVVKGLIITAISLIIINYTKGMYPATVRNAMGV